MSRLKVVLRGTLISEIELTPEKEYIGGRKEGCDIRLQPEKGISREHFKLKFNDGKWQIVDFGSAMVGCGKVPNEIQSEFGFSCPNN